MRVGDDGSGRLIAGRYRLVAELGSGGMGRVWEGLDEQLDRRVALKEMGIPQAPDAERETLVTRALREGRTAAALADHPNVVPVYDVVIEDDVPWIVMQLVRGRSLRDVLQSGPLAPHQVASIADAMLSALGAADAAGVVHRDVKPGNIMLADDGRVLLTDFGIAKRAGDSGLTSTGLFVGTMEYTAPERVDGQPGGLASDLFSLGATLYQAVEGVSPFRRENIPGTLTAVLIEPLPAFRRATGDLRTLIEALTRKVPAERPDVARARALLAGTWTGSGIGFGTGSGLGMSPGTSPGTGTGAPATPRDTVMGPYSSSIMIGGPSGPGGPRRTGLLVTASVGGVAAIVAGVLVLSGAFSGGGGASPVASSSTTSVSASSSTSVSVSVRTSASTSTSTSTTTLPMVQGSQGKITNTAGGLCVDTNGPQAAGIAVQVRTCGNFTGQFWAYDGTSRRLANTPTGFCMDTVGAPAPGAAIVLSQCGGYAVQQWNYDRATGHLTNLTSGLCVDTVDKPADYVDLVLAPCGAATSQVWQM